MASTMPRTNERLKPRLLARSESKIPKPRIHVSAESSSSFPVQLRGIEDVSELSEPTTPAPVFQQSLDLLIDTALKDCVASAGGVRRSWLVDSEPGSDVEELLDDLEFEDCIDSWPENSSPGYALPSDCESMGSWSPDVDRIPDKGEPEPQASAPSLILTIISKLRNVARMLTWLKFQPLTSTLATPATSKTNLIPSSRASSCKSSRSLSSAFDQAAVLPTTFLAARWHQSFATHNDNSIPDDDDDYKSACSDLEAFADCIDTFCQEDSRQCCTPFQHHFLGASVLCSPGQVSLASDSSGADSEQLHSSLLKSSLSRSTISEWLSSGSLQEELSQLEIQQRKLCFDGDNKGETTQRTRRSI